MNRYMKFWQTLCLAPDDGAGEGAPDGAAAGADKSPDATAEQTPANGGEKPARTFTQADIDEIINKKHAAWQKKLDEAIGNARTEGEKLAKLTAEQRAEHERKERDAKIAEREAAITMRELRATALETLAEKGLHKGLADILAYTDAEACQASIAAVETAFKAAVQDAVNEKLKGKPPAAGTATDKGSGASSVAIELGKKAATANTQVSDVIKQYLGG